MVTISAKNLKTQGVSAIADARIGGKVRRLARGFDQSDVSDHVGAIDM
ncbi:MAG: hypothetical protein ABIR16_02640 [Dokdonella sp.]